VSAKKELPQAQAQVDVTDLVCPMTFVKAKVALDDIEVGKILSIRIKDGEAIRNVPRSLKDDGHLVLGLADNGDGTYNLVVKKGQD
jgi:TusA-related sulfurtransferase